MKGFAAVASFDPRDFQKVKDARMKTAAPDGTLREEDVPVWLRLAGSPMFCAGVPRQYNDAWEERGKDSPVESISCQGDDVVVMASTFDGLQSGVEALARAYSAFAQGKRIEKVIVLDMQLALQDGTNHPPRQLHPKRPTVAMDASVMFRVNKAIMRHRTKPSAELADEQDLPGLADLRQEMQSQFAVVVPFSDAAWRTVQQVQATLDNAGRMLLQLAKPRAAQKLLEAGMHAAALPAPARASRRLGKS